MTPSLGILCYHRVVEGDDQTAWPYLERGTAVREQTFRAQLEDIAQFADILDEDSALDVLAGRRRLDRSAVWITFDDGYTDVTRALPYASTGTVFVTTSNAERTLPADAWYAVLLSAERSRGSLDLGLGRFDYDLSQRAGRARMVDGPERRAYLRANIARQEVALRQLARELDASLLPVRPYLDEWELRALVCAGWSVGSHGVTHAPFDSMERDEVQREAATSRDALATLGRPVRTIALPDGAQAHAGVLIDAGYECVLGLGDAPGSVGAVVQARFLVPDDPLWTTRVLRPALSRGADG